MTRPLSVDAATPHSVVARLAHEAWEADYRAGWMRHAAGFLPPYLASVVKEDARRYDAAAAVLTELHNACSVDCGCRYCGKAELPW